MRATRDTELLTPSEAVRLMDDPPMSAPGLVAAHNRGEVFATRTPTGRRLFRRRDIERYQAERKARRERKTA